MSLNKPEPVKPTTFNNNGGKKLERNNNIPGYQTAHCQGSFRLLFRLTVLDYRSKKLPSFTRVIGAGS